MQKWGTDMENVLMLLYHYVNNVFSMCQSSIIEGKSEYHVCGGTI